MVRQNKSGSGRVTPKGAGADSAALGVSREPVKVSGGRMAAVIPFLMFGLIGIGLLIILLNYVVTILGAPSNWYLLVGLGFVLAGIVAATQYR